MPPAAELLALVLALQIPFEQSLANLSSADAGTRLKTVQMLKDAGYPEAAVPLAAVVGDAQDAIQLEAIAAELNIFLAEKIVTKKRLGFVVEVRSAIAAEAAFSSGPLAVGPRHVPVEVLDALRAAIRDDNQRVGLEALYAFGTLAAGATGDDRRSLLHAAGPDLAAVIGAPDPAMRFGAVRVLGRLLARRPGDEGIEPSVGDAVIVALNDRDRAVNGAATQALGTMRYDRAVLALGELFTYHRKGDRAAEALDAIARIANPASATLLATQLSAKADGFRGIAVEGLARVGERNRLADIQTALQSERADSVLLAADFAATLLGGAAVDRIVEAVVKPRLRDQARAYLAEIAPGRSALFARHLQDPDARVRLAVVEALALGADPAALPLVEPLTNDTDPDVARAAALATGRLRAFKPVS